METRKTILIYQYSEKIKSELIVAFKLLEKMATLVGEEFRGAEKLMESFLETLIGEVRIAQNVEKSAQLLEAEKKIMEAIGKVRLFEYPEVNRCLREALSAVTTSCQLAMEELEGKNLL